MTLGLIISDIREDFFSAITKAIESAANRIGYAVILCDSEADAAKEQLYLDILTEKGVEGIILSPVDLIAPPKLRDDSSLPIVQIDRRCRGAKLDYIGIDNALFAGEAVRYLASLGYRRIGYLGHEVSISTMEERLAGYESASRELGLFDEALVNVAAGRGEGAARSIREWMESSPGMGAILCGNANICLSALDAMVDGPPSSRMALATFDDIPCFRFMDNPIAVIRQRQSRVHTLCTLRI